MLVSKVGSQLTAVGTTLMCRSGGGREVEEQREASWNSDQRSNQTLLNFQVYTVHTYLSVAISIQLHAQKL